MHISKRDTISLSKAWSIRAIAILLALIVDGIIIYAIVKMNPLKVYVSLASGAFGTSKRMWFTIRDCMILTCIAIGLLPRSRCASGTSARRARCSSAALPPRSG